MMANSLVGEKSVYLQQHAHNPVHWFPWGEEAFAKARRENKPLLISIGYSTCHWCHVMEHESFEDAEVAAQLNGHFVAIKVDREEHPDVDEFYMEAVQAIAQQGGWPLNMFVTPELLPFFGGTYFPKSVFLDVLGQIKNIWNSEPEKARGQAQALADHIRRVPVRVTATPFEQLAQKRGSWNARLLEQQLREFDPVWGGFGAAPKFPRSHGVSALLRAAVACDDPGRKSSALFAVQHTLKAMAFGGLRDHLRGGFHRYSTDERWLVPHFEKMLYDQALLMQTYSEAYRVFREDFYADIVEETLDYLEAEMRLPEGGFAAAQDADSEGVEGKYYVWTKSELAAAFSDEPPELFERFCRLHSVTEFGNWESNNVLAAPLEATWAEVSAPELKRLRQRLLKTRAVRPAPVRDPKMIIAWNAWMATGLLQASLNLLDRPALSARLLQSAERTLVWILSVAGPSRDLPRVMYGREAKGPGYLEDYAAVIEALQFLASRKGEAACSRLAGEFMAQVDRLFRDESGALLARRPGHPAALPATRLDQQDGATPAVLSVQAGNGFRQALFDEDPACAARAAGDVAPVEAMLERFPVALTHLLCELDAAQAWLIKAPSAGRARLHQEWARRATLASQAFLRCSPDETRFQACDLRSCFGAGEEPAHAWRE